MLNKKIEQQVNIKLLVKLRKAVIVYVQFLT